MLYFYMLVDIPNCLYCQGGKKKKEKKKAKANLFEKASASKIL